MILEAVQAINNCMFKLEYGNLEQMILRYD